LGGDVDHLAAAAGLNCKCGMRCFHRLIP
jgi:hypothetical protein